MRMIHPIPEWDEAALCLCMVGEPLLILGSVQEESYLYVQNECSEGWISAESVAVCRNRAEWLMAAFPIHPLVVTGDMVWLEASAVYPGTSAYRLRMGTVLELCVEEGIPEIKETIETNRIKGTGAVIETTEAQAEQRVQNRLSWNNYIVWLPCRAPDGSFFRQKGLIPMSRDVSVGYLSLTNEEIIKQAVQVSGRPLRLGRNAGEPGLFFLYPGSVPLFWMDPASQYDRAVADASSKNRAGGAALHQKKSRF